MKSPQKLETNSISYHTQSSWTKRYLSNQGLGVPGTFTHSDRGNRQFYRAKYKALDRCLKVVDTTLNDKIVLDAAGGSGQFIEYFLERGARQVLIADFTNAALDIVNHRFANDPRISTQLFDLKEKEHRWTSTYDFVFVMEAIFLLVTENYLARAIKNLASALKVGGYLIISDVFPSHSFQENPYVIRRSKVCFERILAQNRLTVLSYVPQTFVFNRHLFGRFQNIVEQADPLLYWLDLAAVGLGCRPPADSSGDVKYLIGQKRV